MLAGAALLPAAAIAVLAPAGPDDGCPSPRQVAVALAAHLPGTVTPFGQAPGASTVRLSVITDAAASTRVDLVAPSGEILLHRTLSPAERARGKDCPALGETVALIVERYWHEVGYDFPTTPPPATPPPPIPAPAPPPPSPKPPPPQSKPVAVAPEAIEAARAPPAAPREPTPPPRWFLAGAVTGRTGDGGWRDGTAALALAIERLIGPRRAGLRVSAGVSDSDDGTWSTGHATLRQFPLRIGAYVPLALGPGQLEPGLGFDLDVIWADASQPNGSHSTVRVSPGGDLDVGWATFLTRRVYARGLGLFGIATPYRFLTHDGQDVWSTPRAYLAFALELGIWFP